MSEGLAHRLGTRVVALLGCVILVCSAGLLAGTSAMPVVHAAAAGGVVTVAEPTPIEVMAEQYLEIPQFGVVSPRRWRVRGSGRR